MNKLILLIFMLISFSSYSQGVKETTGNSAVYESVSLDRMDAEPLNYVELSNQHITGQRNYSGDVILLKNISIADDAKVIITVGHSLRIVSGFVAPIGCSLVIKAGELSKMNKNSDLKLQYSGKDMEPVKGMLSQNQPNPFTEQTRISYDIAEHALSAYILIHDSNGNLIKKILIPENGKGEVTLSKSEVKSGICVYTLYVDNERIDAKNMISY